MVAETATFTAACIQAAATTLAGNPKNETPDDPDRIIQLAKLILEGAFKKGWAARLS